MKKIILSIGFLLICGFLFSQNPGFMGKHVMINAECYLSPSWKNPNPLTHALENSALPAKAQKYFGLNYFLSPNIEFIVWKKGNIGVGYDFYKSPFKFNIGTENGYAIADNYIGTMTAHGFNVFYKQYLGQTMAPLGHYLKFTFDGYFYQYNCAIDDNTTALIEHNQQEAINKSMLFGFKAEYGYDYVLFNFLRLSMGVSLGSTFGGYSAIQSSKGINGRGNSKINTLSDYADNRVLNAYWFGVKLGIGFIAF